MATGTYIQKINNTYIAAYEVIPGSPLADRIAALEMGCFAVVPLTNDADPVPDPEHAEPPIPKSTKIIYLTKDEHSTADDPYTEWIWTQFNSWEKIGNTSLNLSQYKLVQNQVVDPTVPSEGSNTSVEFIDSISQNTQGVIEPTKKRIPNATTSQAGIVMLGSDTVQSTAANAVSSTASRTYAIQKDANGKLVVNVPWKDESFPTFEAAHQYDASTNPAATVESITARIEALDATVQSTGGTNVALTVTEADGIITGVSITKDDTEDKHNKITSWGTPTNDQYPSAKLVKDSLDTKQGTVTGTAGNFAGFDSNGNLADSGSKPSDFATAAQGDKADTALQGGKIEDEQNNLQVTNNIFTIPKATNGTPETTGQGGTAGQAGSFGVVQIQCITI